MRRAEWLAVCLLSAGCSSSGSIRVWGTEQVSGLETTGSYSLRGTPLSKLWGFELEEGTSYILEMDGTTAASSPYLVEATVEIDPARIREGERFEFDNGDFKAGGVCFRTPNGCSEAVGLTGGWLQITSFGKPDNPCRGFDKLPMQASFSLNMGDETKGGTVSGSGEFGLFWEPCSDDL